MERTARRHLERSGLKLIESNFTVKGGEIDLIMHQGDTLVFVEVRYRQESEAALTSVDAHKCRRIARAAARYLQTHKGNYSACRFDLVALSGPPRRPYIKWLPDAWRMDEC